MKTWSLAGVAGLMGVVGMPLSVSAQPDMMPAALVMSPMVAPVMGPVVAPRVAPSMALPTTPSSSADTVAVEKGQRARLTLHVARPGGCLTGRVDRLANDSLWLACDKVRSGYTRTAVSQIQISQGFPGRARRGWIAGLIGGAISEVLVYQAIGTDGCDDCTRAEARQIPSLLGGGAALLGGYITAAVATRGWPERWVEGRLGQTP